MITKECDHDPPPGEELCREIVQSKVAAVSD